MSNWKTLDIENKIIAILQGVSYNDHHFGRPFISAYQLAIEFQSNYPAEAQQIGLPIGGIGTGARTSLSQYLAGELSQRIKSGKITRIEGAFLGNLHLEDILFNVPGRTNPVRSSLTESGFPLSLFRLKDKETE
jgi:hypothetical protein